MPLATTKTKRSVTDYVNSITDATRKKEVKQLLALFKKITGKKAVIWGDNHMIGFGSYTYKRKGGKEEFEWFNVGFALRKTNITIYLTCYLDTEKPLLEKLGKYKAGKGCLYIKKLSDIDMNILEKLVKKNKDNKWFS